MGRHTEAKARDLRPCPFCGADAAVDRDKYGVIRSVDCSAICDLTIPNGVDWNSRPVEDALRARLDAAVAALAAAQAERAEAVAAAGAAAAVAQVASADAERLRGELAQARADLRVMAGLAHTGIHERGIADGARPALDDAAVDALEGALMYVGHMPDVDVAAIVRRALGVAS